MWAQVHLTKTANTYYKHQMGKNGYNAKLMFDTYVQEG